MSITSSFYSGLSGLDTHATAIQVIGDNIANIHSTGFKNSGAHFEDLLGVSLTGVTGSNQTGAGSEVASVDTNFIQGSLETTDVGTDLAINGKGLFIVGDPYTDELFYTRAGHFIIDNQGYYVNNQGYEFRDTSMIVREQTSSKTWPISRSIRIVRLLQRYPVKSIWY